MSKKNTAKEAKRLAQAVADEIGVYFWQVSYDKEGANWYLRYFIDTDEGINIDQCEAFSRKVSRILDIEDIIPDSYYLEVSSPGMDRELTEDWHFSKLAGKDVEIKLYGAIDGKQNYIGELVGKEGQIVTILQGEIKQEFNLKDVAWVRQAIEF